MNRRDLLKSSATLAAAVVGCIHQEKQPVAGPQAIRLSDDCIVEVAISDYPDGWIVIDERNRFHNYAEPGVVFGSDKKIAPEDLKAQIEETWKQHRLAEHLPEPKVVPGWSFRTVE